MVIREWLYLRRIRRCRLVGRDVAFRGSMSLRVGFEVSEAQARPSGSLSLFLLPVDLDIEFSASSPAPCLHSGHPAHHADNGNKKLIEN